MQPASPESHSNPSPLLGTHDHGRPALLESFCRCPVGRPWPLLVFLGAGGSPSGTTLMQELEQLELGGMEGTWAPSHTDEPGLAPVPTLWLERPGHFTFNHLSPPDLLPTADQVLTERYNFIK